MEFRYQLIGGPLRGTGIFPRCLGEWLVLFVDERRQVTTPENAFALVAYREAPQLASPSYQFRHCLTPHLRRFQVDYADGPWRGLADSPLPMIWLPEEISLPLDCEAHAIRAKPPTVGGQIYLAHYQRRQCPDGLRYFLTRITRTAPTATPAHYLTTETTIGGIRETAPNMAGSSSA